MRKGLREHDVDAGIDQDLGQRSVCCAGVGGAQVWPVAVCNRGKAAQYAVVGVDGLTGDPDGLLSPVGKVLAEDVGLCAEGVGRVVSGASIGVLGMEI